MTITDNRTLLAKADLVLQDLSASNGFLQPQQSKKFIKVVSLQSVLMGLVTVRTMSSFAEIMNKIKFGSRVLRPGQEGVPLPQADRTKPTFDKVEMSTRLFKGEVDITNEVLEDNIEQDTLKSTIMDLLTEAVARDMEEIAIMGDTASPDPFLKQFNGALKLATSNVYDAQGATLDRSVLKGMMRTMPKEFRRDKRNLVFITSSNAEIDWRDSLSDRGTGLGDDLITASARVVPYTGIPVVDIPMFPDALGAGSNETNVLLFDPKNFNVGIWRQIRIETDKNISAGIIKFVVSLRVGVQYAHEPAVVKAIHVVNG